MQRKQRWCGYIQKNVALASGGRGVLMTVMDMEPAKVDLGNMNIKGECLCYRFWGGSSGCHKVEIQGDS